MLIADGGGVSPYRLHPPVPSPVPKPTPTPRPHSLDAGPRPTLKTPQVDPRILRAEGISRAQLLQQQAAAHEKEAIAEQQRAQQARQRADESQQQAQVAEARSRESGSKEDKTLAQQWRKQARDDELNALRCEADANFTGKQAALEKSKLKDMQEGHASEPSRETQAAQVEADAAASTVSLLYDTPPGEADPLKAAGQTAHQLAKAEKWGEWQGAVQQEIRIAGLRALAKGEDPQAAMRERAKTIEQRDVDGLSFTVPGGKGKTSTVSGEDLVQEQRDIALAEDPSQAALKTEFDASQKAWQPLIDAAAKKATQADDQVKADKKALAEAPGGLKPDYMDGVNTSKQAAAGAGENLNWWESRKDVADNGYQQRQADLNVHRTEVDYQVAVVIGDPKSSKDQTAIADAKDARDRALGDRVLVQDQGKSLADGVTVLDDKADLKDAWDTYYGESASQVQPRTVTCKNRNGTEYTQTVYPPGYDKTFWAVPGTEEGKNVHLGDDGKYYYVSTSLGGHSRSRVETGRQELNPAAARVWAAHDKLYGRKDHGPAPEGSLARQKQADSDYAANKELLDSNGQVPGKLDPVYWERRAGEIEKDLSDAKAGVADAQRAMANAQTYGGANVADDPLVAAVGDKVRIREQAQLQADALHAVQQWRASPGDKKLLEAAGKAVAKAGNPQAASKDPVADLRADRDQALKDKTNLKKTADHPGDGQQAALDKISRLDLQIEHDNNLIAQAEAGNQHKGALYLNSQFSFGDKAMPHTEGDVRFSLREDADGRSMGLDAAPPLNYEDLMSKATMDGDDKVLGDSGIRILHETLGLKDVWEVPLGGGMKQYIYQKDGQVFITRTLAEPGQRLSSQTEELWQRLWKADAKVETAGKDVADSTTKVGNWNQLNPGDPILAPGEKDAAGHAPAQPTAPPGLDGKPVKVPTLWDSDLDKRRDDLMAQRRTLHGSMGPGEMPEVMGVLQAELDAVNAMQAAQDAHRALQQWKAGQGPNAAGDSDVGKKLRQDVSDAEDAAIDKKDKWLAQCRSHGLDAAKEQRSTAQDRHQQWKDNHPALVGTEAERSTDSWAALQKAEGNVGGLQQQHIEAATPAAWAAQKALIDDNLSFGQRQDTGKLHELFMANPQVMAQPLINEHYLEYGSGPLQLEGRTHLNNEVSSALGFTPDSPLDPSTPESNEQGRRHSDLYSGLSGSQKKARDEVADEIVGIGGDQAKVTLLPVVYSTPQSGVVKTTLFKVEDGHGGAKYVDERGAHYKDLDDYRANNALPSTDCNIVMPESDKLELDSLGNVKLRVLDARTETGWETFKRRSHFDTIVGGASVVLGVVMTVGSGGMLAPVAAGLLVAASAYGATTSIMSLSNRSSHGLSVNPFTDREARLDWLNLAGSVLAVPTLSAATRAGMVAWQATRAAKAAGAIKTSMPWLAIRGSKETGKFLAAAARTEGPAGARAAAMQNKMEFWSTPGQVMAKPTMVVGGAGLEENTRYMADNWESMSSEQRWEQGGMTLLNLVDFASPVLTKGLRKEAPNPPQVAKQEQTTVRPTTHADAADGVQVAADGQAGPGTLDGVQPVVHGDGTHGSPAGGTAGHPGHGVQGAEAAGNGRVPAEEVTPAGDPLATVPAAMPEAGRVLPAVADDPAATARAAATHEPAGDAGSDAAAARGDDRARSDERGSDSGRVAGWARTGRRQARKIAAGLVPQTASRRQAADAASARPGEVVRAARRAEEPRSEPPADAGPRQDANAPADFSFGPEAAGLKPQELADINAGYRFASADPLVGKLAHDIETMYPGHVIGVNVPVRHLEVEAGGHVTSDRQVTDADILLSDGTILQVKEKNATSLLGQVRRTEEAVNDYTVVIGYAPESRKWRMLAQANKDGLLVTNDRQLLMDLIRPASHEPGAAAGETSRPSRPAHGHEPGEDALPQAAVADVPAGPTPAKLVRVGWRRTMGAVDDAFRARFGDHMDGSVPAAGGRYRFIFGKRRFFKQARSEQLTAPNARSFARDYLAVTRTPPKGADNPFPQVFHRISLTQSPRRVVETIAHELAHAYQSRDYESIGHKYLGDVLAEGGADLVVRRLLGRPLKNAAYGKEERLLQGAIASLGKKGEEIFLNAFFKGEAGAVQKLHTALRAEYGKLPAAERAALETAAAPDPAGPRARAQAEPESPAEGPRQPMPGDGLPARSLTARDRSREQFAVVNDDPATLARRDNGIVSAHRSNTFKSFEEATQAAGERGGAWVYRISPDPRRLTLTWRGRADASEVMGALRIDRDGAVAADRADLLTGSESATRAEVHQLLEASVHGKGNQAREHELIEDALWVKECMPSGDGVRAGRIVVRSHQDDSRLSAWTRMSADERKAANARADIVLQDLVGPDWAQAVSLHKDKTAPANVLRFSDIHLHLGGRSNGYGVNNPLGPRIEQMFQRSGERRGAQVQDVMVFPVPDATTRTPYYMMDDGHGGIVKLELRREGNELVFVGSDVNWPKGRVRLPSGHRFDEGAVTDLNDGTIEWLTRQSGNEPAVQYAEAYVVPRRGLSWRGLKRSEATMREVMKLPEGLASRVKIGLIGGQMAHPEGVRDILQELAVANRLDPSRTKLHIVGGGELTGIKEGVAINHLHQIDLSQEGTGLDLQLHLYDKAGGMVVVHFDANNPSYLEIPGGGHLLVSKTSGTQNLDALYAKFRQYPKATIVHAHWGGLSRSAGPSVAHANKIRELLATTPNVCIDTSWDAAGRRIFQDPHLSKVYAKLINDFPGRFISGSDEVAQMDNFKGAVRLQQESGFARLLDDPDALYTGNFARVVGQAQTHMGAFRKANSGLLVPETLAQLRGEPVATTLDRLTSFDDGLPQPGELPARAQATLAGAGAPAAKPR